MTKRIIARKTKLTYSFGTFFEQGQGGELYVLSQIDRGVAKLIGLSSGNRYSDEPVTDGFIRTNQFKKVEVEIA